MNSIAEYFEYHKNSPSDINEHLATLKHYAQGCDHVTEMGVRTVISTWAFLAAHPGKLISIDIKPVAIEYAQRLARDAGIQFDFRLGDTGADDFEIEETDLLFIDTWHVYEQLKQELKLHSARVRRYIALHDTTTFAYLGESHNYQCAVRPQAPPRRGLWPAVEEFLACNPDWELRERFTHNNGLTILARR
jgi:hypothetical protein